MTAYNGMGCLFLDSRDKSVDEIPNNIIMRNTIGGAQDKITTIQLTDVMVNYNLPTIVSPYNTFAYDNGTVNFPVTIVPGYYKTLAALCAAIQTAVIAASGDGTFTCSTEATSPTFNTVNFGKIRFQSGATNVGIGRIDNPLTYTAGLYVKKATTNNFTFNYANMQYTPYIDFTSPTLNQYNRIDYVSNVRTNNLLNRVSVSGPIGQAFIIEKDYKTPKELKYEYTQGLGNSINITLYDAWGQLLPCDNSFSYSLSILIE